MTNVAPSPGVDRTSRLPPIRAASSSSSESPTWPSARLRVAVLLGEPDAVVDHLQPSPAVPAADAHREVAGIRVALDVPDRLACRAVEELLRLLVEVEPVRDVERRLDPAPGERGEEVAERSLEPRRP